MMKGPDSADRAGDAGDVGEPIDPYLWDGTGEVDPVVARLESTLAGARWKGRAANGPAVVVRRWRTGWRSGLALAASVLLAAGGLWLWIGREVETGWKVEAVAGSPGLGGTSIASPSILPEGKWVRTDDNSRARLRGEGVGTVDVEPGSDLRLLRASKGEHRLELARGTILASVTTPPKVFFVETPAATAVDMGCAYKLKVNEAGEGALYVSLGWVELQEGSRQARVPAGAACRIGAGDGPHPGPGTPWFEDAEPAFVTHLRSIDAQGPGLEELLASARARDSLTLWHLAQRVPASERPAVLRRLAELVPPPAEVDPADPTPDELEAWWAEVQMSW
jgi:hypothetical protein